MSNNELYPEIDHKELNETKTTISLPDGITYAAKQSGRGSFEVGREFWRLSRGRGKLSITDYCTYRLFDSEMFSDEEKSRFISDDRHWDIGLAAGDSTWLATIEDKWLSATILKSAGIDTPELLAVIDAGIRTYGSDTTIRTAEQLKSFLTSKPSLPVFIKPNRSLGSLGAQVITKADDDSLEFQNGNRISYQDFFENEIKSKGYLIQKVIENDPFIKKLTPNTATIRLQNLVSNDGILVPYALLKIPSKNNVADNFWRDGNIICDIDYETGEILTARGNKGFELYDLTSHPETDAPLLGEVLPHWPKVRDLNERCAKLFQPIAMQSVDIALTKSGPLLVENNFGGSMGLAQVAKGKGYLTDEVVAFFSLYGVKLD